MCLQGDEPKDLQEHYHIKLSCTRTKFSFLSIHLSTVAEAAILRQPPYLNFIQKREKLLCIYVKHYTVLIDLMAEPLSPMSILFADHKVI